MKKLFLLLIMVMAVVGHVYADAPQTRTLYGIVLAADDDEPLIGATVHVNNTDLSVITDADGKFSITNVPAKAKTLSVSYVGFKPAEVPITDGEIKVTMGLNAEVLDEVVVTALGISRSEKTLGYSATQVGAADIERAQTNDVMSALQGKVAGLQIQKVSSTPGAASNVSIRGIGSINGLNQPLYVVDGVPVTNGSLSSYGNLMSTSGVDNISPEDIASLTVLKGAAATALYGSRASNGVIMITTKSGAKGENKNYSITYNGRVSAANVTLLPTLQNDFGQGWNGAQTFIENGSWGPQLDGSIQPYGPVYDNAQMMHYYKAQKDNIRNFFDTGWNQNHSIAISGVSDNRQISYYASYSFTGSNGVFPGGYDTFRRNTISFRGSFQPEKYFKISTSANFANYRTKTVPQFQGAAVMDCLMEFPRDISISSLKDLSIPFNTPNAYFTPYGVTNPYWALANNENTTYGKQIFGKAQVDIFPVTGLTLTYRFGFDYSDFDSKNGTPQIKVDTSLMTNDYGYSYETQNLEGSVETYYSRSHELNHDFLANYANKFLDSRFDVNVTAGVTMNERATTYAASTTKNLSIYTGFWDLSNGSVIASATERQSKRRSVSVFGDLNLGWDEFLFLDLTFRNDWSSTLPKNRRSYFYPGITLAGIFSKFIPKNKVLSFGKLRLAYGKTGNDASPYYTNLNFVQATSSARYTEPIIVFPVAGINSFQASSTAGSSDLRPEMTSELEAGLDLRFFESRLNLDIAYYQRDTDDQIFTLPVDPATGYGFRVTNFGKVRNRGVELMLSFTPVLTRNFRWDVTLNWAKNYNKVISLPESLKGGRVELQPNFTTNGKGSVYFYAEEGKPIGTYWTYMNQYVTDPNSPDYGKIICNEYGQPVLSDDLEYTGYDMNHKWTGGISTSLSAFGFTLSATFDIRYGGYMFTRTAYITTFCGNSSLTTYNNRKPFIVPNSVISNGDGTYRENTVPIYLYNNSTQNYFDDSDSGLGAMQYLVNRTFAKLRNLSLTWQVPKKWTRKALLEKVELTLYGNDLFTWRHKSNIYCDPETSTSTSNGDVGLGFGQIMYANPSSYELGLNLKVQF
ncbi:MAG: SusC/RagA family TonB-linked outer membrane protein [Muribaculaceae bacterium]|nr:SusC/RagA family TonB-linked outer membrane protein [Muribaculaceae bacterium]